MTRLPGSSAAVLTPSTTANSDAPTRTSVPSGGAPYSVWHCPTTLSTDASTTSPNFVAPWSGVVSVGPEEGEELLAGRAAGMRLL